MPHGCPLSGSELQVLCGLANGLGCREIGIRTHRSASTIRSQAQSARAKLLVKDRDQAILVAVRHGWIASSVDSSGSIEALVLIRLEKLIGELLPLIRKRSLPTPRQQELLAAFDAVLYAREDDDYVVARELMSNCVQRVITDAGIKERDRPQRDLVGLLVDFVEDQKRLDPRRP